MDEFLRCSVWMRPLSLVWHSVTGPVRKIVSSQNSIPAAAKFSLDKLNGV
ncbi:hypothetical protein [Pseudomonas syringae]|nr:hypothetical protein [Pseudomonas syringae]MCF5372015.1 hypothetical protein [Pseudomonas syringae]